MGEDEGSEQVVVEVLFGYSYLMAKEKRGRNQWDLQRHNGDEELK